MYDVQMFLYFIIRQFPSNERHLKPDNFKKIKIQNMMSIKKKTLTSISMIIILLIKLDAAVP